MNAGYDDPESAFRGQVRQWQKDMLDQHGWYWHAVIDDPDSPLGFKIVTYGLEKSFGHPDIQIVFPLEQAQAQSVLDRVVELIKKGRKFKPGREYTDVLGQGYSVRFKQGQDGKRRLLRMILPDAENRTAKGKASGDFGRQWE